MMSAISLGADADDDRRRYRLTMKKLRLGPASPALAFDVSLALLFAAMAQIDLWATRETGAQPDIATAALFAFFAPPLIWRRSHPCAALTASSVALAAQALFVGDPPSGLPYIGPLLVGAYSVGAYAPWSRRALLALVSLGIAYDGIYANVQGISSTQDVMWMLLPAAAWLLGRHVRDTRIANAAEVEVRRAEREREHGRLAAREHERSRMARELHDILAHSVSLMGVQAGAAEEVLSHDPERARPVLRSLQQIARDSVGEVHRLLAVLRQQDNERELAPQPQLRQLDTLLSHMRVAGLPVELEVTGAVVELAAGVELTAYRVIQEALTNALKHSRPSRVDVVVRYSPAELRVSVTNDGIAESGGGAGHGLIGMTERVSLYGGSLQAGAEPGGCFRVAARIPLQLERTWSAS